MQEATDTLWTCSSVELYELLVLSAAGRYADSPTSSRKS